MHGRLILPKIRTVAKPGSSPLMRAPGCPSAGATHCLGIAATRSRISWERAGERSGANVRSSCVRELVQCSLRLARARPPKATGVSRLTGIHRRSAVSIDAC
jgi:hypothetical protein